ncbi:MAG: ABC transporter permease [Candidatus Methanoplasma sp.]|jgi:ABC-2 type transport system permease protein|nr:ABC transporter permease [Candidatus Methanoplasma sp.]
MSPRAVCAGFRQQAIQFFTDPQWIIPSLITPFMFTMVMLFLYKDQMDGPVVLQAVLGGGVLGMWANTVFASSFSISYDRINGTLEPILISPSGAYSVLIGRSIWSTAIGLANALLVFAIAELMFGTGLSVADPALFFLTLTLTLFSLASMGMLIATTFILTRRGRILSSIMEYPIYVLSGAMVPITALPEGAGMISLALAPAWGVDAVKHAAIDGYSSMFGVGILEDSAMLAALSSILLAAAFLVMRRIERKILETGSATRY